jgi:ADP-heptose:LPS heptosyltransferase
MTVVFHMTPDSTGEKRYWDKFPALAEYLVGRGARITIVGSVKDRPYVDEFMAKTRMIADSISDMVGRTTLDELIVLLQGCDLLVCINSFVMHLGVALGIRMFAIVGATEPKVVLPPGVSHAYSLYARDIPLETVLAEINKQEEQH